MTTDSSTDALAALLAGYEVAPHHFDEILSADGAPRQHWQAFARHAGELTARLLTDSQQRIERQIFENGVTYNVYAATEGPTRPWGLDVLPFIVPADDWEPLTRGLRQRARLLNAIAADLYGPQRLLVEGLVPAALVLAHPGFLRPCHGILPPQGTFLHLVAFDLGRGPDGRWRVVGTRVQAPSGAGYALENRLVVSRLFPDAFREQRVQLLARFFRTLQETVVAAAPGGHEPPHVVLLTPGPYNETYFEHAYLARYLGFTLAEGSDLVVRDDRVYLKTLAGLRRVHAIVRRLDDDFCDPVELRADSTLGVAGLLQAWRAGHVLIANAPGTSVVEAASLFAFLPGISEALIGEQLELPSVATWWCGEAAARADVAARLDEMIIKPATPDLTMEPVFLGGVGPSRARHLDGARRRSARALRPRGVPAALARAGLARGPPREPRGDVARVPRRRRPRRLPADAGRPDSHRRQRSSHRLEPARWQQQGHVGALGRTGRAFLDAGNPSSGRRGD